MASPTFFDSIGRLLGHLLSALRPWVLSTLSWGKVQTDDTQQIMDRREA